MPSLSFLICEMGPRHFLPCQVKIHMLSSNGDKCRNSQPCTGTSRGFSPAGVAMRPQGSTAATRDGSDLQSSHGSDSLAHVQILVHTPARTCAHRAGAPSLPLAFSAWKVPSCSDPTRRLPASLADRGSYSSCTPATLCTQVICTVTPSCPQRHLLIISGPSPVPAWPPADAQPMFVEMSTHALLEATDQETSTEAWGPERLG